MATKQIHVLAAVVASIYLCVAGETASHAEQTNDDVFLLQTDLLQHNKDVSSNAISNPQLPDVSLVSVSKAAVSVREVHHLRMFTSLAFVVLVLAISFVHHATSRADTGRILALDGLRFVMLAGAVVVNLTNAGEQSLPDWLRTCGSRMTWVISAFFLLSGFVLSVQFMGKVTDPRFSDSRYMLCRFMRMYPTYLLSIVLAICFVVPWTVVTEKPYLAVMIPALSAWTPWAVANPLNGPAWCVGVMLFNSMCAPALLRLIGTSGLETRWGTLLPVMYLCTLMAAWSQSGHIFSAMEPMNAVLLWIPHVPEFVAGLVLGTLFTEYKSDTTPGLPKGLISELVNAVGASACFLVLLSTCYWPALDAQSNAWPLLVKWGEQGMLLPVQCMLLWQLASPDSYDPLKWLLSSRPLVALGNLSFAAYIMQQFLFAYMDSYTPDFMSDVFPPAYLQKGSPWQLIPRAWALLAFGFLVSNLFEIPIWRVSNWALAPASSRSTSTFRLWQLPMSWKRTRALAYYVFFFVAIGLIHYAVTHVFETKGVCSTFVTLRDTAAQGPYNALLWFIMVAYAPGMLLNTFGHLLYPSLVHKDIPAFLGSPDDEPCFPGDGLAIPEWRLHFRWVTRGDNPLLVSQTIRETRAMLDGMNMDPRTYVLEVVTDNAIGCAKLAGVPVEEIVVPSSYRSSTGVKFKARALNYAISHGSANPCDWIVHLDEETKLSPRVVAQLWAHADKEHLAVTRGDRKYHNIGQGAIVYGTEQHGPVPNWITTMADTGRVGDDFGKFRIQFENGATVIGMHGSFIAISQTVEELITYDHDHAGSICEDLYFALYAFGHHNVRFDWVDGFMYEQSPFTMMDLIKQRQRWFSGMFLVCFCNRIPLQQRLALMLCCFSWNLVPMMALITLIMTFIEGGESYALWRTVSFFNALMMQSYLIGFVMTYSISEGIMRYLILFVMQLNGAPIFGILEAMGAWRAMTRSEAYMGFHVVQKEVGGLSGENPMVLAEKRGNGDEKSTASSASSNVPPMSETSEDFKEEGNAAELLLKGADSTPALMNRA